MKFDTETQFNLNLKAIDFVGWVKTIQNCIFNRDMYRVVRRNSILINSDNKGKKCYICGLGPSFKDVDLKKLDGDTFVVNRFYKIGTEKPDFVPTYYVIVDNLFANKENIEDFKAAMDTYRDKGTIFILSSKLRNIAFVKEYDPSKVFFVSCFAGGFWGHKEYRLDRVLPAIGNVVANAIVFAMLMGYKNITLLGCDFNSFASTTRNHCYSEKDSSRLYKMSFELFAYAFMAKRHELIQEYAERHDISIVNSTKGSLLDAYPYEINNSLYKKNI